MTDMRKLLAATAITGGLVVGSGLLAASATAAPNHAAPTSPTSTCTQAMPGKTVPGTSAPAKTLPGAGAESGLSQTKERTGVPATPARPLPTAQGGAASADTAPAHATTVNLGDDVSIQATANGGLLICKSK